MITSEAKVSDVMQANALLNGQEVEAYGDAGYQGADKRPDARNDVRWNVAMRPSKIKALDKSQLKEHLVDQIQTGTSQNLPTSPTTCV